jgi:hypothetical protein
MKIGSLRNKFPISFFTVFLILIYEAKGDLTDRISFAVLIISLIIALIIVLVS